MRRLALTAGTVLLAFAGAAAAHAQTTVTTPVPVPTPPATPLRASLDGCQTALTVRSAVFSGSMPPVAGSWRMRMRFDLFMRRVSSAKWRRVAAAKWGIWHVSRPRVPGFVFTKVVNGLAAPASYRAVVQFRWYDMQGSVIRSAQRTSATCAQPDPRPDLRLSSFTTTPLSATSARYTIVVGNAGFSAAGAFDVVLTVGDRRIPISVGAGLAATQQRALTIDGPSCSGVGKVSILLDPDDIVDEAGGRDAPIVRPCPL